LKRIFENKRKKTSPTSNNNSKDAKSNKFGEILRQVMYCLQPAVRFETIFRTVCKSRQKYFERKENNQYDLSEKHERNSKPPTTADTKRHHADSQRSQLLQLAMDWNCVDVAKELILQNSLDNILNKEEVFLIALKRDLPEYVYIFLKLAIDPSNIFFENNIFIDDDTSLRPIYRYRKFLQRLYSNEAVNSDKTQLSAFIESDDVVGKHIRTTHDLNDVLTTLIGDYMYQLYLNSNKDGVKYRVSWGLTEQNQISPKYFDDHIKPTREIVFDIIM
ncbi:unnamed protein product, partial [Adineta steineri]